MKPFYLVSYESRHYEFWGVGESEAQAKDICVQGMRAHAKQCGISETWWWDDFYTAEVDAMSSSAGLFNVRKLEVGGAYRDGEPI